MHDRHVEVHRDVTNSVIVSGDQNTVYIYHYHLDRQHQSQGRYLINPYQSLAAFQVEDAEVYFGRGKEISRLWKRLSNLYEQSQYNKFLPRLLPILGPSGSGKSSLARAGLLPELARRPLAGYKKTRAIVLKPGNTPLDSLALILARIVTNDPSPSRKKTEFREILEERYIQGANDGLSYIASILPGQDYPLVVLVDQFEEIYSSDTDPRQQVAFVETLLEAAVTRKAQISVVITLRSDFLGETQQHQKLNQVIGSDWSVFLPIMTSDELRLAIEKPAEVAGHPLDYAAVEQLVEQTQNREGALPLLQFTLSKIWRKLSDDNFSKSAKDILREIGGVGGALGESANRIYGSLSIEEQDVAQRIFIELVQSSSGANYIRRSNVNISNLIPRLQLNHEQVIKILRRFSLPTSRLITLSSIECEERTQLTAEITHESIFKNWNLLHEWINDHKTFLKRKEKIEIAEREWREHNRKNVYLLQGFPLIEAIQFQKEDTKKLSLSDSTNNFIKMSRRQRSRNRLRTASWLIIPALLIVGIFERNRREFIIGIHREKIENYTKYNNHEAVSLKKLTEGCGKLTFLPNYLSELLSGNCRELKSAPLEFTDINSMELVSVNFYNANFSSSFLNKSIFINSNLRYANLEQANLQDTVFRNTDLKYVKFRGAILLNTDFIDALNLKNSYLKEAFFCNVFLPDKINIDRDRDCEKLPQIFFSRYPTSFNSLDKAKDYVNKKRREKRRVL